MKRELALMLLLVGACKKSESTTASDPAPTATEHETTTATGSGGSTGSAHVPGDHHGRLNLDTNGDGVISDEERAAGRRKRIEKLRTRLDTNADGKLTVDELKAATGRMKFDNPEEMDTNKDGDVSVDELEAAMKARRDKRSNGSAGSAEEPAE